MALSLRDGAISVESGSIVTLLKAPESFIDLNTTNFQRVEGEERMRI